MTSQMQHDYNIVRNVLKALSIALQATQQARRQRGGSTQHALQFSFLPPPFPIYFLPPTVFFWPEKPFEFVISARKRLGFRRRPFFFFSEITRFSLKLRLNPIQE